MENIILIGAGGHARACVDVVEQEERFKIAGLIDDSPNAPTDIFRYPVLGDRSHLETLRSSFRFALVCIGQIKTPEPRINYFRVLRRLEFILPAVFSPSCYISKHAHVDEGVIVMHRAIINAGATIQKDCIINSGALIEHDAVIGQNCHISTNAVVNGGATVLRKSFVGSGAVIREGVLVGESCIIGAQSFVDRDISSGETFKNAERVNLGNS